MPEGRMIFSNLTVDENLAMGAYLVNDKDLIGKNRDYVFSIFPRLKERLKQMAGTLSGGEQQMLAIARMLRTGVKVLLLDEPTEGLAPVIVQRIGDLLATLKKRGMTILIVEQNFRFASRVADRFYLMEHGRVLSQFPVGELERRMDDLHDVLGV